MSVTGAMGAMAAQGLTRAQASVEPATASPAGGFGRVLGEMVERANAESQAADRASTDLVVSQGANLHETMIALERADLSVRFTLGVAQRLVQAYNDLSRMQV